MLRYFLVILGIFYCLSINEGLTQMKDDGQKQRYEQTLKNLSPMQFHVTQECGTEPPFKNEFWNHHEEGIYVDVVSGEPLFSSLDKFDSKSGWPSFTKPIQGDVLKEKRDLSHGMVRVEVRSVRADSHLGHVFSDGPAPTGLRYCINSASLRFIPRHSLQKEGYGELEKLFKAGNTQVSTQIAPGALKAAEEGNRVENRVENRVGNRAVPTNVEQEVAILAGGCFWGVEELIRSIPGVISTEVGYTGGVIANPNYLLVSTGKSGHAESVRITFDPKRLTYKQLLHYFFKLHDPTTLDRQGNDRGTQYRSSIFFTSTKQQQEADEVIMEVNEGKRWPSPVVTKVEPASDWYKAEDYHQDYLQKNPGGYTCHYWRS